MFNFFYSVYSVLYTNKSVQDVSTLIRNTFIHQVVVQTRTS